MEIERDLLRARGPVREHQFLSDLLRRKLAFQGDQACKRAPVDIYLER
jgi:hypothetical protein